MTCMAALRVGGSVYSRLRRAFAWRQASLIAGISSHGRAIVRMTTSSSARPVRTTVPTPARCVVTVEDGGAVKVQGDPDHPPTHGALCTKVSRYPERTYHPERVLHPLQRVGPKGSGRSSGSAGTRRSTDIAARLKAIAGPDGATPRRSCPTATPARWAWCRARAWRRASSTGSAPRCSTARSAPRAGGEALAATYGAKVGMHVEHFAESRLILIWGSNSIT